MKSEELKNLEYIPKNSVIQGDCLEVMKCIQDKSIDCIICDLPYGTTANPNDVVIPFEPLWEHYKRIIKDNGAIILFAQGLFYVDLVNSNRKWFRYDLVWDKILPSGFLNANRMPLRSHEQIAVFYKKLPTYNPQMTEGAKLHHRGKKGDIGGKIESDNNYGDYNYVPSKQDGMKFPTSILTYKKPHASIAKHRTEKSIPLLEWLVKTYSNEGDLILDNTCGSGTTLLACQNTNRNYIGIELDENYYNVTNERLEENTKRLKNEKMKKRLL